MLFAYELSQLTCVGPFSSTDIVSRLFLVVFQVLGASAIISSLASYWCRFMPCSYELSAISSSRDEEMSSGIEEMEAELNAGGMEECRIFAMALRKFRKDCENFATIAKISQSLRNFAMHIFSLS